MSHRFLRSSHGNVAMMFGLLLVPLIAIVGSAIDYSRAASDRTKMQTALDTTALMLSREASSLAPAQIQQKARDYFMALMGTTEVDNFNVTITYTASGQSQIAMSASGSVDTTFMGVVGVQHMPIATSTTATWGNTRLRVSLVLDNTGSMASSGKMIALKAATHSLLGTLQAAAKVPEDVYVSIIPFSKDVNVGAGNSGAGWVRWDLWDAANGTCTKSASTMASCQSKSGTWTPKAHTTWNGCITDRDQPNDTNYVLPLFSVASTMFPAEQYASCPVSVLPLTNDWTALSNKVDAMIPVGNTNQTIGMQLGMQSILANTPLANPALQGGYSYEHVIVLLTDGLNTQNRWSTTQSQIDVRTAAACAKAKSSAVTMYVVQVNTDGDPTSTMLQNCATNSSKFFMLTDASAIVSTFDQIGTELSKLRLAY
jgi:Flp pilus assembly protein TadG